MTYLIPAVYKFILLIVCLSLVIQTLSRFFALKERIALLSLADAEILACAQRKANLRNLEDAFRFIKVKRPDLLGSLSGIKTDTHLFITSEAGCTHPLFKEVHAAIHKQRTRASTRFWPNWVFAIDGAQK